MSSNIILEKQKQVETLRKFAFIGVTLSTVAAIICLFSISMIYNYMQHVQTMLENEVGFCRVRYYIFFFNNLFLFLSPRQVHYGNKYYKFT